MESTFCVVMPVNTTPPALSFTRIKLMLTACVFMLAAVGSVQVAAAGEFDDRAEKLAPVVAGYERFVEDDRISPVERGLLLINELGCTSCHGHDRQIWAAVPRTAPNLTAIGDRVQAEYFERFLLDPHGAKPGTTMPDLLADQPEPVRKEIANGIAHFLASTGNTAHQPTFVKEINRGRQLYHSVGCVACHNPQQPNEEFSTSVPLGKLTEKYTVSGLSQFLRDPLKYRSSGRMPKIDLPPGDARSIAAYLLRDIKIDAAIRYQLYAGKWEQLPDFSQLEPIETATVPSIDVDQFKLSDNFGLVFGGFWEVDKATEYTFRLGSDDGSRLIIDDNVVIDNDGLHSFMFKEKRMTIDAGIHTVRIEFFERSAGQKLACTIESESDGLKDISTVLRATKRPAKQNDNSFVADTDRAARGVVYFQMMGCANCHQIENKGVALTSRMKKQKSLTDLDFAQGCVGNATGAPRFNFSDQQRESLVAALKAIAKNDILAPETNMNREEQQVHQQLTSFNCYSCHSRETGSREEDNIEIFGGVVDKTGGDSFEFYGRDEWFTGTEPEMGDEGRQPPGLKLVGAKLKKQWLEHLFAKSSVDRPYMNTRMPIFGAENLSSLVDSLVAADQLEQKVKVVQTVPVEEVKIHGRFFAGGEGLSCIKCHTFGDFDSTGIAAISLTTMTQRLEKDWFQLYMLKPSRFRRGTRMPESWPGGKTFYPDRLDGDVDKQIDSIWQYLSDGDQAATPKGLIKGKLELIPRDVPIVYRNFITGAGPRAIAVGYPEAVNLAFDADNCRLAMVWQENFIDASRHWTGRGQGFEPPLGDKIIHHPASIPCFDGAVDSWPTTTDKESARQSGMKFRGYSFDKNRRPTFQYQYKESTITDRPVPFVVNDTGMLKREFTIEGGQPFKLRLMAGDQIESTEEGYLVDGKLLIRVRGDVAVSLATLSGKTAIIVDIDPTAGVVQFSQEYRW